MKQWRGIQREDIEWHPDIDPERCTGCRTCIDFCQNDVLEFDEATQKAKVKNPDNCVVGCRTCARLCEACAITFPDEEKFIAYIKEKLERKR